jgi:hypothetical protein
MDSRTPAKGEGVMRKKLPAIILVVALAVANSCGTTAKARAKEDMENSKAAYERCLQQNLDDPSKCEIFKRAYEVDLETYRQASKATTPVATGFIEFGAGGSGK